MKKKIIICIVLLISVLTLGGYIVFNHQNKDNDSNEETHILKNVEKTEKDIPDTEMDKIENGIKNWAKSTLGMDNTFSKESRDIINEKFYEIIVSHSQRKKIEEEQNKFYENASIRTKSVDVSIKKSKEAIYNQRKIGYIECIVTVSGARNNDDFKKIYNLSLMIEYQQNVIAVYEIENIELR